MNALVLYIVLMSRSPHTSMQTLEVQIDGSGLYSPIFFRWPRSAHSSALSATYLVADTSPSLVLPLS